MNNETLNNLKMAAITLNELAKSIKDQSTSATTKQYGMAVFIAIDEIARNKRAIKELHSMIDGGEECRGRDSEISNIIYILEGVAI